MAKPDLSLSGPVRSFRMAHPLVDGCEMHPDDAGRVQNQLNLDPFVPLEVNGRSVFAGSRYVGSIRYPESRTGSVFYFDAERGC